MFARSFILSQIKLPLFFLSPRHPYQFPLLCLFFDGRNSSILVLLFLLFCKSFKDLLICTPFSGTRLQNVPFPFLSKLFPLFLQLFLPKGIFLVSQTGYGEGFFASLRALLRMGFYFRKVPMKVPIRFPRPSSLYGKMF